MLTAGAFIHSPRETDIHTLKEHVKDQNGPISNEEIERGVSQGRTLLFHVMACKSCCPAFYVSLPWRQGMTKYPQFNIYFNCTDGHMKNHPLPDLTIVLSELQYQTQESTGPDV